MRRLLAFLPLALLCSLPACRTTTGGVGSASAPLTAGSYKVLGGRVEGRSTIVHILGFIPISASNTTDAALGKAVAKGGGDALISVTADTWSSFYILWSETTTEVSGIPVTTKR